MIDDKQADRPGDSAAAEAWHARIAEIVAAAPPLTDAQRAVLRGIIAPVLAEDRAA